MRIILVTAICAGALGGSALAFDNAQCAAFLIGSWDMSTDMGAQGRADIALTFTDDGKASKTLTIYGPGGKTPTEPPETVVVTWTVSPGSAPDLCAVTFVGEGKKTPEKPVAKILDDDTFSFGEATLHRRKS